MRFLFVDRIMQLSPAEYVRGIKHITRDDPYVCSYGGDKLCFVSSLIGEALGQLAAWNIMASNEFKQRPVAGLTASAKLYRPAYVGETLLLESFIDQLDESAVQYHSVARVGEELVFTIDGALGPLLPMNDFIDPAEARRQFAEINRPGDWPPTTPPDDVALLAGNGSYQAAPMLFDRILHIKPGVEVCAEKRITRAAPYFPDHFPNKPVLPLTVLLECILNLAREFVTRSEFEKPYRVHEVRKVKMKEFVYPGDTVVCYLFVRKHDANELALTCRVEVDGKRVCVLEVGLV